MATTLGFIGLGIMGEPMCRNLATKSGAAVVAFDQRAEPLAALARDSVRAAGSAGEMKSLLPDTHPTSGAFPTSYIGKP